EVGATIAVDVHREKPVARVVERHGYLGDFGEAAPGGVPHATNAAAEERREIDEVVLAVAVDVHGQERRPLRDHAVLLLLHDLSVAGVDDAGGEAGAGGEPGGPLNGAEP